MNPKQLTWTGATEYTDGTSYLPADRKGYDASIRPDDGQSLPADFIALGVVSQTQDYVMPISELANPPGPGKYLFTVREVDNAGDHSAWAADVALVINAVPKSPTGLSAS